VYCHPNPKSFNHAILDTFAGELQKKNEVRLRDLYALDFDSVLKGSDFVALQKGTAPADIQIEQDHIRWADVITFVFPIWWTGLPARLKGYIDRVFSHGFAYSIGSQGVQPLLSSKKAVIFNTTGSPKELYESSGMVKSLNQMMEDGILRFCGIQVLRHVYFNAVPFVSDADRKAMLEEVRRVAQSI